jgi:hypothetical protein
VKFTYIKDHRDAFDVAAMCNVFGVTAAGFSAWLTRPPSARARRANELAEQVLAVHHEVKGVYGSIKITKELRHRKTLVHRKTVARLKKQAGITSKVCRRFRVQTTDSSRYPLRFQAPSPMGVGAFSWNRRLYRECVPSCQIAWAQRLAHSHQIPSLFLVQLSRDALQLLKDDRTLILILAGSTVTDPRPIKSEIERLVASQPCRKLHQPSESISI